MKLHLLLAAAMATIVAVSAGTLPDFHDDPRPTVPDVSTFPPDSFAGCTEPCCWCRIVYDMCIPKRCDPKKFHRVDCRPEAHKHCNCYTANANKEVSVILNPRVGAVLTGVCDSASCADTSVPEQGATMRRVFRLR
jgi:hypothetical protein